MSKNRDSKLEARIEKELRSPGILTYIVLSLPALISILFLIAALVKMLKWGDTTGGLVRILGAILWCGFFFSQFKLYKELKKRI